MYKEFGDLRRGVNKVLEKGKSREHHPRNHLEIAVSHVVHKINISNITNNGYNGALSH